MAWDQSFISFIHHVTCRFTCAASPRQQHDQRRDYLDKHPVRYIKYKNTPDHPISSITVLKGSTCYRQIHNSTFTVVHIVHYLDDVELEHGT